MTGWDTGFPQQDAQSDFSRARRRRLIARLAAIACDRYRFLRTHEWDENVLERLRDRRR